MFECKNAALAKNPDLQGLFAAQLTTPLQPAKSADGKTIMERFNEFVSKKKDKENKLSNPFLNFAVDPNQQPLVSNGLRTMGNCESCHNCGKCGKSETRGQLASLVG